jgi:hypothetical protein
MTGGHNYGFYFEKSGRGATQGAIDPAEEYFEGSRAEVSVVRETGQNALDAASGNTPVRMEFELARVPVDQLPGVDGLRAHLESVVKATQGSQGHERMVEALEVAKKKEVWVLRISDFGTTGLKGSESVDDARSGLSALTRGSGISSNDSSRGGSFGIGSAVGPMASLMSTVYYTSLPEDQDEVVLAGYSRLATHPDADGVNRVGDGFYTDLNLEDDFRYRRSPGPIGPFLVRDQPGTDIYVVAYRTAEEDQSLDHVRDAFIDSFMMAIHHGRLEVTGRTPMGEWRLNATTLVDEVRSRPEALAFYRAIKDPEPYVRDHPKLGQLRLLMNVDDTLPKTLHTITMRKPLMRIDMFRHTSIPVKYAAVLVCDSDEGNALLRSLEAPQHDVWDKGRAPGGDAILRDLKRFVREGLKSRVKETVGDMVEIKGLAKYLPSDSVLPTAGAAASPTHGDQSGEESATVHGREAAAAGAEVTTRRSVKVQVQRPTSLNGNEEASTGEKAGGHRTRRSEGGNFPGPAESATGSVRISAGDIRFRSWSGSASDAGQSLLCVALTSTEGVSGDIEFVPLGPGGSPEPDYELPVLGARLTTSSGSTPIEWTKNTFRSIALPAGETARLEIELPHGHRYRLDVR